MADEEPFYAHGMAVFKRPVHTATADGKTSTVMGFRVCDVADGVQPEDVARYLNAGAKALGKW
jgi:hypothetical protein